MKAHSVFYFFLNLPRRHCTSHPLAYADGHTLNFAFAL